ncbi:ABC transporter permease [Natrarchaeobius chitinivorans]|uniref:ABC transporter permease n=1 Tax=Natrarchaeobius chitinivorans TaxID=1679083 RepID=A0A3N6M1G3_NATCH|nr:ABC transporter permease [Natrarchaeobius chitinivorans]RQG94194.1 ABC transporter permease [Natrarchaeobius chitinivorans]
MVEQHTTSLSVPRQVVRMLSPNWTMLKELAAHRLGQIGLAIVAIYGILAVLGPVVFTVDPSAVAGGERYLGPSLQYPFGTDGYGRDIFALTILGARVSLYVAVVVVGISTTLGIIFGLISAYFSDLVDEAIMRAVDVLLAFPGILLALVIIAILGPGLNRAVLALAIAYTPIMTRIVRGNALAIREEEYVLAAKSYGESHWRILFREMLPNLTSVVIVQMTITFAFSILSEASLSYLGLSAQPPQVTWGVLISEGQSVIGIAPWVSVFPGLTIMFTVLGLTLLGVALRDVLDPQGEVNMTQDI